MLAVPFPYKINMLSNSLTKEDVQIAQSALSHNSPHHQQDRISLLHQSISQYWNTPYVASFMSGRAALYAVIQVLGLETGDQVIIPAFTSQSVTNAIKFNGCDTQFVDIELDTYGIDAEKMRQAITPYTKAVIIQHTFGLVSRDLDAILDIAREHGLWVIEDCAQATGARYKQQLIGTFGDIAIFSSERSKVVNTIHGGWAITTNPELGEKLQQIYESFDDADPIFIQKLLNTLCHAYASLPTSETATHPDETWPLSEHVPQVQPEELNNQFSPIYRWRMAPCVAALLTHQLSMLPTILQHHRKGAKFWLKWAKRNGIAPPKPSRESESTWLRFPILVNPTQKKNKHLLEESMNVELGVWYTTPMDPWPLILDDCPNGMLAAESCINIPTWLPEKY